MAPVRAASPLGPPRACALWPRPWRPLARSPGRFRWRTRAPALLISRLVSWVDDLWCRAIGAGV
nr:PE family protein [Mycobacterium pseudoshottsii]